MTYINAVSTLIILAAVFAAFMKRRKLFITEHRYTELSAGKWLAVYERQLWVLVMAAAVFLRIFLLGKVPDAVNQDTAMAALNAKSLMTYGTDLDGIYMPMHLNGWGYAQMNALSSYLMIPVFKLLGMNRLTVCIPIVIFSILGMIAGYFLVREMFGIEYAVLFNVICAFNPWHLVQSRWSLEANFFPHFFIIAILMLYYGIRHARKGWIYGSMAVFGISHYNYGVTLYTVFSFLVLLFILLCYRKMITRMQAFISWIIYIFVSWPFYTMIFINTFHLPTIHTPFFTIPLFTESRRSGDILFFSEHPLRQLFENLYSFFSVVFLQRDEILWSNVPHMGTLMFCMLPLLGIGFIAICCRFRKGEGDHVRYDIIFAWLIASLIDGIITKDVNSNRLNIIFYCCLILIAVGFHEVLCCSGKLKYAAVMVFTAMSLFFTVDYFTLYAGRFFDPEYAFSGNLDLALEKAQSISADHYVITPDTQYTGAKDVSEIDTMFVWDVDARYYRGETDEMNGIQYLPYTERFQYRKVTEEDNLRSDDSTVYVVNSGEQDLFDISRFNAYNYTQYYVIIPKWLDTNTQ